VRIVTIGAQPLPHQARRHRRRLAVLLAGLLVAAGAAVALERTVFSDGGTAARPELQRILDGLVTGSGRVAPGVTAYVSGPHGVWSGSAGLANVETGAAMKPDARMRLASVSKWWTAALVLRLEETGRLSVDDTVERWLPGLLPYGGRITLAELMTDSSGLIDDNDMRPATLPAMLARVQDVKLHAQLEAVIARLLAHPEAEASALWPIRLAAWQPLLFTPGTAYHHSNIGWNILGLVAQRAGGRPIAALLRDRIFEPLGLAQTAFDPQGQIAGPHAEGYSLAVDGTATDTTAREPTKFVDGGIVSNAQDTATFFTSLMQGELVGRAELAVLERRGLVDGGGRSTACAGRAHVGDGASESVKTNVLVARDGSRVAVLLLNGALLRADGSIDLDRSDGAASAAALRLFCAS
jgi:D-alanyl-D-alanine carboxypeptidase